MTNHLEISHLWFRHQAASDYILKDISLTIGRGEVIALVGLSGCGKSTLCYCIAGIIPRIYPGELKGEILLEGKPITEMTLPQVACRLGFVFQNPDNQLFSPTVEDEIAFGPENLCLPQPEIEKRVVESLSMVGMLQHRYKNPHHLSGGQKQLIALAAVLALNPEILIFDEALSQLDSRGKAMIQQQIRDLKSKGKTIIMIEHDLNNIVLADRVLHLKQGALIAYSGSF